MKIFFLILTIFIFSSSIKLQAQCGFTGTTVTTQSRCQASGTITVNMTPAAAYTYQITSGPATTGLSSINSFTTLPVGNYQVTVTLGGCSIILFATVTGNYVAPGLLTGTVKRIACPQGSGCVTLNQPINGRPPYSYAISSGPITTPLQASPVFCNLPAGVYNFQAYDSCGVIRSTNYTMSYDTGTFVAYTYGYDLRHANCSDLIVCPLTGFSNTSSHTLIRVWYVKPNGDTLKVNNFESPVRCDTLVGESHTYGTWKMLGYDTCGRVYTSTFAHAQPGCNLDYKGPVCGGFELRISNAWKYGVPVGYRVRRCSDNAIVYEVNQTPQTTYFSPYFLLNHSTCYIFEHYNNCGDTVRRTYTTPAKPVFNINACEGTACGVNGKGSIRVWQDYLSGTSPINYRIIDGLEGIGMTASQGQFSSYVYLRDLALGTYQVEGTDACGQKDTLYISLTKPLVRSIEITPSPNCSGGANLHIKVTSNFNSCAYAATSPGNITYVNVTNPYYNAINVTTVNPTATTPGVWEGDLINVSPGSLLLRTYSNSDGCTWDTTYLVQAYTAPALSNIVGYICNTSGVGTINYTISGGKAPYQYRLRRQGDIAWSAWQSNTVFPGITSGVYELNVIDDCPNGSINSFSFLPWTRSGISSNTNCATVGNPFTIFASPNTNGVNYSWYFNDTLIGTGAQFTIPNFQPYNMGNYKLRQVFPGSSCVDSFTRFIINCAVLPVAFDKLNGKIDNNGKVQLQWNTLQEQQGLVFYIERSKDGSVFEQINTLQAKNKINGYSYTFFDANPENNIFYRIKYSVNGERVNYSNTIKVLQNNIDADKVFVSPNPFTTKLQVDLYTNRKINLTLKISDLTGRTVFTKPLNLIAGYNKVIIENELKLVAKGIYILEINGGQEKIAKKIFKQ